MTHPKNHQCRPDCGACCVQPSISSPLPGFPLGKPALTSCPFLDENCLCRLFDQPERPAVCRDFCFDPEVCGENKTQAFARLAWLEQETTTQPHPRVDVTAGNA